MKLFLSLSVALAVFPLASALICTQYAKVVLGKVNQYSSIFVSASNQLNNEFGKVKAQNCDIGQMCVGEATIYRFANGTNTGIVWTRCENENIKKLNHCFRSKVNFKENNSDGLGETYRCVCNTDNCHTVEHLHAMFDEAFRGRKNLNPGPRNPYLSLPPYSFDN